MREDKSAVNGTHQTLQCHIFCKVEIRCKLLQRAVQDAQMISK